METNSNKSRKRQGSRSLSLHETFQIGMEVESDAECRKQKREEEEWRDLTTEEGRFHVPPCQLPYAGATSGPAPRYATMLDLFLAMVDQ